MQIILSRAIWHYYFATGQTCFNKHEVALRLKNEVKGYQFLDAAKLATEVRMSGFEKVSPEILESLNQWCGLIRQWEDTQPVNLVPTDDESNGLNSC